MSVVRSERCQLGLLFATVLALSMQPTKSHAYTQEEQAACSGDAFRLCGSEIPDVDRVTTCMVRRKSELSPGCRVYFRPTRGDTAAVRADRSVRVKPVAVREPARAKSRKDKKPAKPTST